jgi:hypothetical protein
MPWWPTADGCRNVRLLEHLFFIERLPACGKRLRARAAASPKVHVIDTGVAAQLMRIKPAKLAILDTTALAGHWSTHDGDVSLRHRVR